MIKLPSTLSQNNASKFSGSMFASFGADLSEKGAVKTVRAKKLIGEDTTAAFDDLPVAITYFDYDTPGSPVYCVLNGGFWYGEATPGTTWTQVSGTDVPGTASPEFCDMKVFNSALYATEPTSLHYYNGSWSVLTSLDSDVIHILQPYAKRLYFVDENLVIKSIDTANTIASSGNYTLDLTGFEDVGHISWIESASNKLWIGVTSNNGGRATVFEWDGVIENTPTRQYKLNAPGTMVCAIVNDIPTVVDSNGVILGFNGGGFTEIARFPVANYDGYFSDGIRRDGRKNIHFNGKLVDKDRVIFNVDGSYVRSEIDESKVYEMPSGLWCLDLSEQENSGLYHYCSPSISTSVSVTDYGEYFSSFVGAVASGYLQEDSFAGIISTSNIIFGVQTTGSPNNYYLCGVDSGEELPRTSSITLPFIKASEVTDTFQGLYAGYEKLLDSTDTIIAKYRAEDIEPIIPSTGTITSSTTITFTAFTGANIGDEITFTGRSGAGHIAHISNISTGGGTTTITIDDALPVSSGSTICMIMNFKKITGRVGQNVNYTDFQLPNNNKDVKMQLKLVMRATAQMKLYSLAITNKGDKLIKD